MVCYAKGLVIKIRKGLTACFVCWAMMSNKESPIAYLLDLLLVAEADKLDALKTHKKGLMQQLFLKLNKVPA